MGPDRARTAPQELGFPEMAAGLCEAGGSVEPPQEIRRSEAQTILMRITIVLNMARTVQQIVG